MSLPATEKVAANEIKEGDRVYSEDFWMFLDVTRIGPHPTDEGMLEIRAHNGWAEHARRLMRPPDAQVVRVIA